MPTNSANKVKYGLKNVYYAVATEGTAGSYTYAAPVAWPGAVSLTLDPDGDNNRFYADDGVYYAMFDNNGYTGSLETALVPDSFRKAVLGETEDDKGVLYEKSGAATVPFALLFEFTGDAHKIRHVMYNCVASRPAVSSQTKGQNTEVQTETLNLDCGPAKFGDDYYVKAKTGPDVDSTVYSSWFTSVHTPASGE